MASEAKPSAPAVPLDPDSTEWLRIIEAILFVGGEPLRFEEFARAFPEVDAARFRRILRTLQSRYQQQRRAYQIVDTDAGFVLELTDHHRDEMARRLAHQRPITLGKAALEVLSVVAYQQPISKPQLDTVLDRDAGPVLRRLIRQKLLAIEEPTEPEAKPAYRTTDRFLELFQLESIEDLPAAQDPQRW